MSDAPVLGIDFGGVIVPMLSRSGTADTQFNRDFLEASAQPGAVEKIGALVEAFQGRVWIVSKAGARTEARTREWLHHQNFFAVTGLDAEHLRFCLTREEKGPICRELAVTHFVDDRLHIMQILKEQVSHLYLFGDKEQNRAAKRWVNLVEDWSETHELIMRDL